MSKKWGRSDILATIGIIVGIIVAAVQIWVSIRLDSANQTLQKLDTLIEKSIDQNVKSEKTNGYLSAAVIDLHSQLELNQGLQEVANHNTALIRTANINKLFLAARSLQASDLSTANIPRTIKAHNELLAKRRIILTAQLENPFLLENQKMYEEWTSCIEQIIFWYTWGERQDTDSKLSPFPNDTTFTDVQKSLIRDYWNGENDIELKNIQLYYDVSTLCSSTRLPWMKFNVPISKPTRPRRDKRDYDPPQFKMVNGRRMPLDSADYARREIDFKESVKRYLADSIAWADWNMNPKYQSGKRHYAGFPPLNVEE